MSRGEPSTAGVVRAGWALAIDRFTAEQPGRSVSVMGHGVEVGVDEHVPRPAASVAKLFVAIALIVEIRGGRISGDRTVAVSELPATRFPTVTAALRPDHRFTLTELAALSLATSDNPIADHLVSLLGPERITQVIRALGCTDTSVDVGFDDAHLGPGGRANRTSTRDCARSLHLLLTDPDFVELRPALRSSLFNTRILAKLPDDLVVSHKTGTLAGVANDVGVVHAPSGDLTMCFLTDEQADLAATSAAIARCARDVFDHVQCVGDAQPLPLVDRAATARARRS